MGRLVFTSGEILTAANMNELSDQSVMVFADSTARSSAIPTPSEGMVTYVEDANRVEVYDGAAFGPIGGILQVVSTTKTDTFVTTSTSFTDVTGLAATITPSSAASKILIFSSLSFSLAPNGTGFGHFKIVGGNTASYVGNSAGSRVQSVFGGAVNGTGSISAGLISSNFNFLDAPNTTGSVTYQMQAVYAGTGGVYINRSQDDSDNNARARGASTITVMEVAV